MADEPAPRTTEDPTAPAAPTAAAAPPMPVGWAEGAARVRGLVERTDLVPAALFTAARPAHPAGGTAPAAATPGSAR